VLKPESTKNCPAYGELIDKMEKDSAEYQKTVADSQVILLLKLLDLITWDDLRHLNILFLVLKLKNKTKNKHAPQESKLWKHEKQKWAF
jgi:hypothetical protein